MRNATVRKAIETAVIAAIGAIAFNLLHIPAGTILGAMVFVAGAALAGRPLGFAHRIRAPQLAVMGIAAGTSMTPAAVEAAGRWPLSIAALIVATIAMQICGYLIFRRLGQFDRLTAFLAAAPGSLAAVLILAEENGADVPRVAVPQTLRITCIVASTPFLLTGVAIPPFHHAPALLDGAAAWAALIGASLGIWMLAERMRWPLPAFLGPMTGTAALHLGGVVSLALPHLLISVALAGLGGAIGSRFSGVRVKDVVRLIPVSFAALAATGFIGIMAGWLVGTLIEVGPFPAIIAFSPGSMEMMIAVSVALNMQPAYVTAHHIVRVLLLLAAMPFLVQRTVLREKARADAGDRSIQ